MSTQATATEFTKADIEKWKRVLLGEALERITPERLRIEHALKALGHDPDACVKVEQAIEWWLRQPIERNPCDG